MNVHIIKPAARPLVATVGVILLMVALLMAAARPAAATASHGVSSTTLSDVVVGQHEYVAREITIEPGGSTGWHYHQENVYGFVAEGTLTHDHSNCKVDGIYRAGSTIVENAGPDNVHIGRNLGTVPVVLFVFQVTPVGGPLSVDQPNPGCSFS